MKSMPLSRKLTAALSESGLSPIGSRNANAAIITMKRGTVIPVHHYRIITVPGGGKMLVAGIGPGSFVFRTTCISSITSRLRDFYGPIKWIPHQHALRWGRQDDTGWGIPDEEGRYDCSRDYEMTRKFKKILTMSPNNIAEIKPLPPGTDVSQFEKRPAI